MDGERKPYEGQEPYIFISYARKDKDRVFPLLDALAAAGYRFWYDEGIPWTTEWADVIAEHITNCAVFLAFHSETSKISRNCREEVYYALGEEKNVLSVYLDGVRFDSGLRMRLAPYQAVKLGEYESASDFLAHITRENVFLPCKMSLLDKTRNWHTDGEIQWVFDSDGVLTITKNDNLSEQVKKVPIPACSHDYVNSVAPWISYRSKIISVVISDTISKIGILSFARCENLTNVRISQSVTEICGAAFEGCYSLRRLYIPQNVTKIGFMSFWGCTNLAIAEIPAGAIVDTYAFDPHTKIVRYK